MASGMGRFVAQKNYVEQQNDQQRMPPPAINTNRSAITAAGSDTPRAKFLGPKKFATGRSIPRLPDASSPMQSPIAGVRKVVDRFSGVGGARGNGQQEKTAFDTDLESTTGTEDSVDTLNAADHNQTRMQGQNEGYEDDEEGPYDEQDQNGFVDKHHQHWQNGPVDQGEQIGEEEESSEEGEGEEEDDEHMPMDQHGPGVHGEYNGHNFGQHPQPQQYAQAIQHQQGREFDNLPVRGGSPNNLTSRMADARKPTHAPARRMHSAPAPQTHGQQQRYGGPDNFQASSIGDEESDFSGDGDEDEVDQQLNGHGQPQMQMPYQNHLQVHQQQQKPRQPNPMHDPSGTTVMQRIMEAKGMAGGGDKAFEGSELPDETTTFDSPNPVQPPKKVKVKEKRRASPSPLVRKRVPSPELDYEKPTLFNMPYSELANQAFETKPPSQRPSSVVVKGKTLPEKLEKSMTLSDEARQEFLNSLTIKDWEEAGGWFVTRFGDVMGKFVDLRKGRRATAERFEARLLERDTSVQRGVDKLKSDMADMRKGGEGILRGKSPGRF